MEIESFFYSNNLNDFSKIVNALVYILFLEVIKIRLDLIVLK